MAACAGNGPSATRNGIPETAPAPAVNTPDLRFGSGYRAANDPCLRVGRTDFTAPHLSSETDLVGCPVDFDKRNVFIQNTNAREATRTAEWVLYSVPLVGSAPTAIIPPTAPITGG